MWTDVNRWRRVKNMEDTATYKADSTSIVSIDTEPSGWGFFTEEIGWFLTDFFTHRLEPEDKLIFFSYYITGMTLEEIAERFHCTHQAIHKKLIKINKMLSHAWQYSDRWREKDDSSRS